MKPTRNLFTQYATHSAFLFIEDAIVILAKTKDPLVSLAQAHSELKLDIHHILQQDSIIIANCRCKLSLEQLSQTSFEITALKTFLPALDPTTQANILKAYQWLNWDKMSQYCGQCGTPLATELAVIEKKCTHCHLSFFPKLSVAVMVLIYRENELLLARSPHFRAGIYSAIAGFVEIGESAEAAAHREVKEELNIEITDLEYFSSQTWPFPDSFMVAFKAKYLKGSIIIDQIEIEDARWFKLDNLPPLPSYASIARKLIDHHLNNLDQH